jgi:hypothetical protein
MASEPLHIFDPRRNFQLQGFTGRGATTTVHDATQTGISISGIFQAAEDFAVLYVYNAYDYFNHLRLKHLPRTDLSGLKLGETVADRRSPGIASRAFVACVRCGGSGRQRGGWTPLGAGRQVQAGSGRESPEGRFPSIPGLACGVQPPC